MLQAFKDSIRTERQKRTYYWTKRVVALGCAVSIGPYIPSFFADYSIIIKVLTFFVSYVTIAPVVAGFVCFLDEMVRL